MSAPVRELAAMLAKLDPRLDPQFYAFISAPDPHGEAIASVREEEGWSSIVDAGLASDAPPMRRITLRVHSCLEGVGLTAAVAGCLAKHGIACNMVAGFHHDHLFVPAVDADRALDLLRALQGESV